MKFIGQYIQSFIARFRNDVFLEDVSSGTIASGGNLGLDSNNKIVKATISSTTDLTSDVTGTLPVGNGGTGATSLTDNKFLLGNGTSAIEASSHLAYFNPDVNSDYIQIGDSSTTLSGITTDNAAPLTIQVDFPTGQTNAAGGDITFIAGASTGTATGGSFVFRSSPTTGSSGTSINAPTDIAVLSQNGNLQIDGSLTVGSTSFVNSSGVIQVGAQTNITSLGTLTTLTVDDITINGDTITASDDLNIVATGNDIDIDTNNFTLESTAGNKPDITLKSTGNHNKSPVIQFVKDKGAAGADSDAVGVISFKSDNDAQEQTSIAGINVVVEDASDGSEEGKVTISVKNTSSSGTVDSFILTGNGTATDASIGSGSASVTTIAGTLTIGSTAFVNNSGVIQVATQGTIDHDSLANFVAAEHYRWDNDISSTATINAANIPTLNQSTTGNAATATALTSGDKTIEGNLRIGGSGDTSNNWISIDAQNGSDTTGGGITFYETGTYSVSAPQYGAKIVYNEDDDEFAMGTMHNNTFMRQIHMDRGSTAVYLTNLVVQNDSTSGPYTYYKNLDTSIADGQNLARTLVYTADRDAIISRINWVATEDHDSNSGGCKIDFLVTPNGDAQAETTAMTIGQDSSLTVNGVIELGNASDTTIARSAAGKVTIEGNEIQTTNYHHHFLNAGFFMSFPFSRYIPLNGSINEQNTSTSSPEYTNFTWPYDGFVKKMILRTETDMGSTELKLYKGASGATVSTAMGAVTQTVDANNAVEFDFTSVTNTYSKGETMAVRVDPTDDPDGGQNITIELVFDLTT
jgi:hypothetical protein